MFSHKRASPSGSGNEEEDDSSAPKIKQLKVRQKIGHRFRRDAKHALGDADDTQIQRNGEEFDEDRPSTEPRTLPNPPIIIMVRYSIEVARVKFS